MHEVLTSRPFHLLAFAGPAYDFLISRLRELDPDLAELVEVADSECAARDIRTVLDHEDWEETMRAEARLRRLVG